MKYCPVQVKEYQEYLQIKNKLEITYFFYEIKKEIKRYIENI